MQLTSQTNLYGQNDTIADNSSKNVSDSGFSIQLEVQAFQRWLDSSQVIVCHLVQQKLSSEFMGFLNFYKELEGFESV